MDIFLNCAVLFIVAVVIINTVYATVYKVANMPSTPQTRRLITDDIRKNKGHMNPLVIFDLGSGWGGLCRKLSAISAHTDIRGYEISPVPYSYSRAVQAFDFFRSYKIRYRDLFTVNIGEADVIICYLSPSHMARFEEEVVMKMKSGSTLYSQGFELKGRDASYTLHAPYSIEKTVYCYSIP